MTRSTADEHRANLVSAAVRVMAQDGVGAATTRRIAAEAGVAQTTIHYVFGSKTELYRAVIEAVTANMVRALDKGLDQQPDDWRGGLERLLGAVWDNVEGDPINALLVLELTIVALRDPELKDLAVVLYEAYQKAGEAAGRVLRARTDIDFRVDIEETAALTVAMLNGVILSYLVHDDRDRAHRDLAHLTQAVALLAEGR